MKIFEAAIHSSKFIAIGRTKHKKRIVLYNVAESSDYVLVHSGSCKSCGEEHFKKKLRQDVSVPENDWEPLEELPKELTGIELEQDEAIDES